MNSRLWKTKVHLIKRNGFDLKSGSTFFSDNRNYFRGKKKKKYKRTFSVWILKIIQRRKTRGADLELRKFNIGRSKNVVHEWGEKNSKREERRQRAVILTCFRSRSRDRVEIDSCYLFVNWLTRAQRASCRSTKEQRKERAEWRWRWFRRSTLRSFTCTAVWECRSGLGGRETELTSAGDTGATRRARACCTGRFGSITLTGRDARPRVRWPRCETFARGSRESPKFPDIRVRGSDRWKGKKETNRRLEIGRLKNANAFSLRR